MEIEHHDEREFVKWYQRLGPVERMKVRDELNWLLAAQGRLEMPHVRELPQGLRELRVRVGQQPRLYFQVIDERVRMLAYGRKDTQQRDMQRAWKRMT
ncbi:MAG: Phage derived protein Gp49-like [Thermoleophilia bacterium]|nr:Phage derived protein Gp49-like [Thermoleophilia bacterium]